MSSLSQYFTGIAAKRLSAVETDPETSNQHEFNGTRQMVAIFGRDRIVLPCQYLYLGNDEVETTTAEGKLTWYDARENHATRTEYRLYFQSNSVTELAAEGDLLVVARRSNGNALALVAKRNSTFESQVLWLFGIAGDIRSFSVTTVEGENNKTIGFAERTVLESIGIETETPVTDWLDTIIGLYGLQFPSTRVFSTFARNTLADVSATDNPDIALLAWLNQEEMLFRTLERHIVQVRLDEGFQDVDDFVKFSLSVHNRRKSRVGFALENHLEQVFIENGILFSRGQISENNAKPDFIFPSIEHYRDAAFQQANLTMLGAKSTCKDRWRQVLSEARRIDEKHLLTLEPGISRNQTEEMIDSKLQLVLPQELHSSYSPDQQNWLMNLTEFIDLVRNRQSV